MKELSVMQVSVLNGRRPKHKQRVKRGWILSRAWGGSELRLYELRTASSDAKYSVVYQGEEMQIGDGDYHVTAEGLRNSGYKGGLPYAE